MNFEKLGLTGLAIRIDGSIRAFTVGEKLNNQIALIHIEKADHSYLGLSQFLSQTFCEQAWADCGYINRMGDLGIEGLRRAKLALGPHHMAKRYNIILKKSLFNFTIPIIISIFYENWFPREMVTVFSEFTLSSWLASSLPTFLFFCNMKLFLNSLRQPVSDKRLIWNGLHSSNLFNCLDVNRIYLD